MFYVLVAVLAFVAGWFVNTVYGSLVEDKSSKALRAAADKAEKLAGK